MSVSFCDIKGAVSFVTAPFDFNYRYLSAYYNNVKSDQFT
jgi:hypothetical protein